VDNDQKAAELKKITKKGKYCYIPVVLAFFVSVISINAGANPDIFNLMVIPGLCLSLGLMAYHIISAKCPICNQRFYSLWDLVVSGTFRKYSCCNCKFSLNPNNQSKPYPKSTGDEWNH
jgi:hypothetical protein